MKTDWNTIFECADSRKSNQKKKAWAIAYEQEDKKEWELLTKK